MGKVIKRIDPQGVGVAAKTESYTYYANGLLKTKVDRNQVTTTYIYDVHQCLLSENTGGEVISYIYDKNGNQLTQTDSTGITTRIYDEANRVTEKTVPNFGKSIYTYDITSGVIPGYYATETKDPTGDITRKVYDQVGRLSSLGSGLQAVIYTYYANWNH